MARKPKAKKPEPDDKEQSERFVETARKLEVDESGKSFGRAFRKISAQKYKSKNKDGSS